MKNKFKTDFLFKIIYFTQFFTFLLFNTKRITFKILLQKNNLNIKYYIQLMAIFFSLKHKNQSRAPPVKLLKEFK